MGEEITLDLKKKKKDFECKMENNNLQLNMADDVQEAGPEIAKAQTCLGSKQCGSDVPFNDVRWP